MENDMKNDVWWDEDAVLEILRKYDLPEWRYWYSKYLGGYNE